MKRTIVAALLALGCLGGCGPKEINYSVTVLSKSCDPSVDPFEGVQFVRVAVTGDGMAAPLTAVSSKDVANRQLRLPEIPSGAHRSIEVRGYDSDPGSGSARVLAVGRSLPFDVPDVVPADLQGPIAINVFLRKTNAFNAIASAQTPGTCQRMRVARAGHTATLLQNGKVYLAGGYNIAPGGPVRVALADAEFFNPGTGTFDPAHDIAVNNGATKLPKAFHTATRLPSGRVLLWGGESYYKNSETSYVVTPTPVVAVYDPETDEYGALGSKNTPVARTQHQAVIDVNGKVLIVGGLTRTGSALVAADKVQWFNPADNSSQLVKDPADTTGVRDLTFVRVDGAAAAVHGGEFIAVAGGTDGTRLTTEVSFFKFDGSVFRQQSVTAPPRLVDPGRRSAGAATMRDGSELVLLGGFNDAAQVRPVATTEIISTQNSTVAAGPAIAARGNICAVTLKDGSVLAIGGRAINGAVPVSDGTTTLVTANSSGGTGVATGPSLVTPRYAHTCTLLADGSVLVTGGVNDKADGTSEVLQDTWIFQPTPTDN